MRGTILYVSLDMAGRNGKRHGLPVSSLFLLSLLVNSEPRSSQRSPLELRGGNSYDALERRKHCTIEFEKLNLAKDAQYVNVQVCSCFFLSHSHEGLQLDHCTLFY